MSTASDFWVDMAQADQTLRTRSPAHHQIAAERFFNWKAALGRAAKELGYGHFMDVPGHMDDDLISRARAICATFHL